MAGCPWKIRSRSHAGAADDSYVPSCAGWPSLASVEDANDCGGGTTTGIDLDTPLSTADKLDRSIAVD
jgi:hypothetical protein